MEVAKRLQPAVHGWRILTPEHASGICNKPRPNYLFTISPY